MTGTPNITRDVSAEDFAEEKFRLAIESCPNGMVMTDSAGRIVLANTETERLFGYQYGELIGQTIEVLVPERLRNGHLQRRIDFARHPKPRRLEESRELFGAAATAASSRSRSDLLRSAPAMASWCSAS